ncbi:MAG: hypothetical protein ACOYEL_04310 [Saccharofermentanales bacterium]
MLILEDTVGSIKGLSMNWELEIKKLHKLQVGEVRVGASEREGERAVAMYNRALDQIENDNWDVAMIALDRLTSEFSLFSQAAYLYGLCLCRQQNWRAAEEMFQKAQLSDLSEQEYEIVEAAKLVAREGKIRDKAKSKERRRKDNMLNRVKADLIRGGVLERSEHGRRADKMRMATAREREEVLKQIRAQEQGKLPPGLKLDTGQSDNRKVQLISLIVIICAVIFLLFYFLIRPGIISNRRTEQKLDWLEQQMEQQAPAKQEIADLLDMYRSRYPHD